MSQLWRLLKQSADITDLPPLLISTIFNSNSYTINVTDLTYIWSESLDRRNIIKRSLDEETSIDPSEDAEQMRVFLEKIRSALEGAEKTSLSIQAQSSPKPNGPASLELRITVELPKGLSQLKWPVRLKSMPQSSFSSQLTFPLLRAQNAKLRELYGLMELLRDKDHIIQKLADKLEATGAELGHVFPSAAGKGGRKMPRKVAEERVKGLALFNEEAWKHEMRGKEMNDGNKDIKAIVRGVFGGDSGSTHIGIADADTLGNCDKWWDQIESTPVELLNGTTAEYGLKAKTEPPASEKQVVRTLQDEDDDFQVQSTPHKPAGSPVSDADPMSSPPTLRSQAVIEDSTDDDDDDDGLDGPSQRSAVIPDSFPRSPLKPQTRKLGAIGGSITQSKAPAEIERSLHPKKAKEIPPVVDDDETATEDENEESPKSPITHQKRTVSPQPAKATAPRKRATSSSPAPPTKPIKSKLGKIGGRANEAAPSRPSSAASEPDEPEPAIVPERKTVHKLGVIGHRATAAEHEKKNDDADRGRAKEKKDEKVEAKRETSEERANRKREELKKELEEKAKHPVRKKRKF